MFGLDSASDIYGQYAFRIPLNTVIQKQGDNLTSFVGFSELEYFPFQDVIQKNIHTLVLGELIVRPHFVVETNRFLGLGLDGIATSSDILNFSNDDVLMVDNISHFKDTDFIDQKTATELAKDDMYRRVSMGIYAAHIPVWFVMMPEGDDKIGMMGCSKTIDLLYGSDRDHTIIKGDAIIRPHSIFAGDDCRGYNLSGILTGGYRDLVKPDNLAFDMSLG